MSLVLTVILAPQLCIADNPNYQNREDNRLVLKELKEILSVYLKNDDLLGQDKDDTHLEHARIKGLISDIKDTMNSDENNPKSIGYLLDLNRRLVEQNEMVSLDLQDAINAGADEDNLGRKVYKVNANILGLSQVSFVSSLMVLIIVQQRGNPFLHHSKSIAKIRKVAKRIALPALVLTIASSAVSSMTQKYVVKESLVIQLKSEVDAHSRILKAISKALEKIRTNA